jgi:hypothetical protein
MPQAMPSFPGRGATAAIVACLLLLSQCGCINTLVMAGKVFGGDPKVKSPFEQITGVSLAKSEHPVALVVSAPAVMAESFDTLQDDLQEEVIRRMKLRGVKVVDPDRVHGALQASRGGGSGRFDPQAVARSVSDVAYVLHVDVEEFSCRDEGSRELFKGRADGKIYAYEVRHTDAAKPVAAVRVFEKEFRCEYPASHPISRDTMSEKVFQRRFIDGLSDLLGRTFYDVKTSELIAQD